MLYKCNCPFQSWVLEYVTTFFKIQSCVVDYKSLGALIFSQTSVTLQIKFVFHWIN